MVLSTEINKFSYKFVVEFLASSLELTKCQCQELQTEGGSVAVEGMAIDLSSSLKAFTLVSSEEIVLFTNLKCSYNGFKMIF